MIEINLKKFQENTVDFLYETTVEKKSKPKIILESPTGSGKTIILISYIEKFLENKDDTIFCWFCPGKAELEEQSREKMKRLSPSLNTGEIQDIINNGFEKNTTYFINWEKITKKDNNAIKDTERKNLYNRISEAHQKNFKFITIIDEEHQNNTPKAEDIVNAISGEYEIRVSATPSQIKTAEVYKIKEEDVINEELITKALYINKNLENVNTENIYNETELLLKKADEVRKEIAEEYKKENENINPL
ncbi:MAG: DEAD/DEAH box helicase family protein, partial [Fusobacterium sp.]|nr:DEAD/DEAH box helicase family protein [Fusobacterium sp.]